MVHSQLLWSSNAAGPTSARERVSSSEVLRRCRTPWGRSSALQKASIKPPRQHLRRAFVRVRDVERSAPKSVSYNTSTNARCKHSFLKYTCNGTTSTPLLTGGREEPGEMHRGVVFASRRRPNAPRMHIELICWALVRALDETPQLAGFLPALCEPRTAPRPVARREAPRPQIRTKTGLDHGSKLAYTCS